MPMDYTAIADLVATPTKPTPKSKRRGSKSNQDDPQADPPRPKRRPIVGGGGKFVGMKQYGRVGAEGTGAPSPKSSPSPSPVHAPESPPSFAHSKVGRTTEPPQTSPPQTPPPSSPPLTTPRHLLPPGSVTSRLLLPRPLTRPGSRGLVCLERLSRDLDCREHPSQRPTACRRPRPLA